MIKYLAEFFEWLIEIWKKPYKEDFFCSLVMDIFGLLSILAVLFTGVTKCMNTALHRDTPPKIEQAAPAGCSEQAAPAPKPP